jgi:hypothetical protein
MQQRFDSALLCLEAGEKSRYPRNDGRKKSPDAIYHVSGAGRSLDDRTCCNNLAGVYHAASGLSQAVPLLDANCIRRSAEEHHISARGARAHHATTNA